MYEVYHAISPTFGLESIFGQTKSPKDLADFKLVAKVRCDNPEIAFGLTQHLDVPWSENKGVYAVGQDPETLRSTSVGDLIIYGHVAYQVLSIGFKRMAIKNGRLFEFEEEE
jgi:hypothetical protein